MTFGSPRARRVAVMAAMLAAAPTASAFAQQSPTTTVGATTTPTTTPIPNQVQPSVPAQETPPTTVSPAPSPQTYTRFPKTTFKTQGAKPKRLTAAVQMTKDVTAPARGFTAPTSMAADPDNPRVVVAAVADLRPRTCHLLVSTDAGRTWRFSKTPPAPAGFPFCTSTMAGAPEASVAWGRNHTLYYGLMAYDIVSGQEGPRDGRTSIAVARTTDLGDTWSSTFAENNRSAPPDPSGAIRAATGVTGLTVDTSTPGDTVYVGFSESYTNVPTTSPLANPRPMMATSADGGRTFATPVNLNDFARLTRTVEGKQYNLLMRTGFGAPFIVAHDGVVLAVAGSDFPSTDSPTPPHAAGQGLSPGTLFAFPNPQVVARSTDQGKTWTVKEMGPPVYQGTGSMTGLGWTKEGGGSFVALYGGTNETSSTNGIEDVLFQRSTDGGVTWTAPVSISDDQPDQNVTNFYPQLQVAPNGRIDAVWEDDRDSADFKFNVRHTYSTDGGKTWAPNVQINDQPLDFNLGVSLNSDVRFPPGLVSTNSYTAVGWADSRLGNVESQTQDAFAAVAQRAPLPATNNTVLPFVAAAFGGLVAAGLILLMMLTIRRRRGATERTGPVRSPSGESVRAR